MSDTIRTLIDAMKWSHPQKSGRQEFFKKYNHLKMIRCDCPNKCKTALSYQIMFAVYLSMAYEQFNEKEKKKFFKRLVGIGALALKPYSQDRTVIIYHVPNNCYAFDRVCKEAFHAIFPVESPNMIDDILMKNGRKTYQRQRAEHVTPTVTEEVKLYMRQRLGLSSNQLIIRKRLYVTEMYLDFLAKRPNSRIDYRFYATTYIKEKQSLKMRVRQQNLRNDQLDNCRMSAVTEGIANLSIASTRE